MLRRSWPTANAADGRVRQVLIARLIEPVIPGKSNRKVAIAYDKDLYMDDTP
ncbi:MAG: hypothetical protein ACR2FS_16720 [Phormidesmis sp.]